MQLALSAADESFRTEVRRFLDEKLTPDLRDAGKRTGGVFTDPPATTTGSVCAIESSTGVHSCSPRPVHTVIDIPASRASAIARRFAALTARSAPSSVPSRSTASMS